jgi:hypothetical protein
MLEHQSQSWVNQPRTFMPQYTKMAPEYLLDETYETVNIVPGLKTSLFPHQKPIIRAMIDLENNRQHRMTLDGNQYNTRISAGVLSEAVGSGKTIDILSVILMQKIPKVYPDISVLPIGNPNTNSKRYGSIIRKRYKNILKTSIVFAGLSVLSQWVQAIKTFTSMTFFVVYNVRDLQKLIEMMSNKSINQYDIVLVKNGKVTRAVKFPPYIDIEYINLYRSTLHIYNIIANMRNFCWARVVIDDFDTIGLPPGASVVNGLFTWYVSSTIKNMRNNASRTCYYETTSDMLMYSDYSCGAISRNSILFQNFNIRNKAEFVAETNNISTPEFFAYVFKNPNNQYMGYMGLLGPDGAEIMEMLNGDAISTAAERLGIQTNSVADIFQLMLDKKFTQYRRASDAIEFITEVEPMQGCRTPMSENINEDDTYKKSDIFIRREILFNYPNLKGLLANTKSDCVVAKASAGVAIDRVKSNIKEGECPICMGDLDDADEETVILKCCGTTVCGVCCFGIIFPKRSTVGQCSNCRSRLNLKQLIYLKGGFDLQKIVNDDLTVADMPVAVDEVKVDPIRTKYEAIMDIINGVLASERKQVDVSIDNLMKGTAVLPEPTYNKVLIFASYNETLMKIKEVLDKHKIPYDKLGGTHLNIAATVEKFRVCTTTCVLLINSMKHCSGLNLQSATDLIFAHKIIDRNIETQVIGRGQRLGRTTKLRVHFMFYQNEYDWMVHTNSIRDFS